MAPGSSSPSAAIATSHLPLTTIDIPALPLNTHNLSWSPDLELAVAADDSIYIFLPTFPTPSQTTTPSAAGPGQNHGKTITKKQYSECALRFPATEARSPEINRHLFDAVGIPYPDDEEFDPALGAGQGPVTRTGASLNHVVNVAWSPGGLGRTKRSVLAVLSGQGMITIYCESGSLEGNAPGVSVGGRKSRVLKPLVVPWSVGCGRLVPITAPSAGGEDDRYGVEYITSMAWAAQLDAPGDGALLGYLNDADEMVLLAVQAEHGKGEEYGSSGIWRVEEVARFFAGGPHPPTDAADPDFMPHGTPFGISWSPWKSDNGHKTALVSYICRNHVGFRRVMVQDEWAARTTPSVQVDASDTEGICLNLSPDAFITWEDKVWKEGNAHIFRGIIATPFRVQAFRVPLDLGGPGKASVPPHTTSDCGTIYLTEEELQSINPITGLVIHRSTSIEQSIAPLFSLVRLSATHLNDDWYQTNVPEESVMQSPPEWATEIKQTIDYSLPQSLAYRPRKGLVAGDESGSEDEADEEEADDDDDDDDDDWAMGNGEITGEETFIKQSNDTENRVHTTRMRIWGLQISPGGGSMVVFTSDHDTIKPERSTFAGLRCRLLFGKNMAGSEQSDQNHGITASQTTSTEAQSWEWMYGNGRVPSGIDPNIRDFQADALKTRFAQISSSRDCSFCNSRVVLQGTRAKCSRNHSFETCAATDIPILEPSTSNTCGVCSSKCLRKDVLDKMLVDTPQRQDLLELISPSLCGRCGGKFDD